MTDAIFLQSHFTSSARRIPRGKSASAHVLVYPAGLEDPTSRGAIGLPAIPRCQPFGPGATLHVSQDTPLLTGADATYWREGTEDVEYRSAPVTFKAAFDMHWFVGPKDGVGHSSSAQEWSTFKNAAEDEKFFRSQGFKTSRTILNGLDHHDYNLAKVLDQDLKKAGL